jgi:hypothetical protein
MTEEVNPDLCKILYHVYSEFPSTLNYRENLPHGDVMIFPNGSEDYIYVHTSTLTLYPSHDGLKGIAEVISDKCNGNSFNGRVSVGKSYKVD